MIKPFNELCDCSDRESILVDGVTTCPGCHKGFCSARCAFIKGHSDRDEKPCPYYVAIKYVWEKK